MYSVKSFSCYNMNGLSFVAFVISTPIGDRVAFIDAPVKMDAETLGVCQAQALRQAADMVLETLMNGANKAASIAVATPVAPAPVVAPAAIAAIAAATAIVASAAEAKKPVGRPKKVDVIAAPGAEVAPVVAAPAVVLDVEAVVETPVEFDPLADVVEVTYVPYLRGKGPMQECLMAILNSMLPVGWSSNGNIVTVVRDAQTKLEAAQVQCLGSDGLIHPSFDATARSFFAGVK